MTVPNAEPSLGQGLVRGRAEPRMRSKFLEFSIPDPERLQVCKSRIQTFSPKAGVHAHGDAVKLERTEQQRVRKRPPCGPYCPGGDPGTI